MSETRRNLRRARIIVALFWVCLSLAAVAAPVLVTHAYPGAASLLYLAFSPVCHQEPARSFSVFGQSWAICHRCSGIYLGTLCGAALAFGASRITSSVLRRRLWVAAGTLPLFLDALLPRVGVWVNTPASRFITGTLFGIMIAVLLVVAVSELLARRQNSLRPCGEPATQTAKPRRQQRIDFPAPHSERQGVTQ
jgi:uncharacterized membrane protein